MIECLFPVLMLWSVAGLAYLVTENRARRWPVVLVAVLWCLSLQAVLVLIGHAAHAAGWWTR